MIGLLILLGVSSVFLIFLIAESILYNQKIKRIPLRISVSGTRGKSSITRTLASVFRAHGIKVLAKTTGSEAMYILPDGSTEPIRRRGVTTILEQKKLIARAVSLDVDCIITEIMSIHPDNHKTETHKLIKPTLTVFSNFRADHTDVVGESIGEITGLFINDIFPGSRIILPEKEVNEYLLAGTKQLGATLIAAKTGISEELNLAETVYETHINTNLDAVTAAARYMGIPDDKIIRGILDTKLDKGQLGIFRIERELMSRKIWFVNAFAANDPFSTVQVIEKTMKILVREVTDKPDKTSIDIAETTENNATGKGENLSETEAYFQPKLIGLISLRSDRGERSQQWLNYLQTDGKDLFNHIYVSGTHSPIFTRKLKNCTRLITNDPDKIINQIIQSTTGDIVIFGIANIHGLGFRCLNSWSGAGFPPARE
jgi:poly-gamma-glutamate synthase PgsB/CapB